MMKVETNVYLSNNDGKDWKEVDLQGLKTGLQRHPYFKSSAVISTGGRTQYLTQDRGLNWDPLQLPLESAATSLQLNTWSFHPTEPEWMIFLGENGCNYRDDNCHAEAFYTTDSGKNWHSLATWVRSCSWSRDTSFKRVNVQGIYCEEYADKSMSQKQQQASNTPVQLVYSDDFMRTRKVLFESVVGYAIYSDYLIAAEVIGELAETALHLRHVCDERCLTRPYHYLNFRSTFQVKGHSEWPSPWTVSHSVLLTILTTLMLSIQYVARQLLARLPTSK